VYTPSAGGVNSTREPAAATARDPPQPVDPPPNVPAVASNTTSPKPPESETCGGALSIIMMVASPASAGRLGSAAAHGGDW
jgi:hypothetical protein